MSLALAVVAAASLFSPIKPAVAASPALPSCRSWAATQRGEGLQKPQGRAASFRTRFLDSGGGLRPVNRKYVAIFFPEHWEDSGQRRLIVDLHGTGGSPEENWGVDWVRVLTARNWAYVGLKYVDDASGVHDDDTTMYANVKAAFDDIRSQCDLGATVNVLMGFSRGSAQAFSLAALDLKDRRLFSAIVHNSGAWIPGRPLPPTLREMQARADRRGLAGSKHFMYCGERDHSHEVPMCEEMTTAREFVLAHGGAVEPLFKDARGGHGGLAKSKDALDAMFAFLERSIVAR